VIEGIVGTMLAQRPLIERWLAKGMGVVLEAPEEARGERVAVQWVAGRRGLVQDA
jgi:hypothetical protein